jgi:hypothetical protein
MRTCSSAVHIGTASSGPPLSTGRHPPTTTADDIHNRVRKRPSLRVVIDPSSSLRLPRLIDGELPGFAILYAERMDGARHERAPRRGVDLEDDLWMEVEGPLVSDVPHQKWPSASFAVALAPSTSRLLANTTTSVVVSTSTCHSFPSRSYTRTLLSSILLLLIG